MKGLHLIADLYQCRCEAGWLADAATLQAWCASVAHAAGMDPRAHAFHGTDDGGISGTVLGTGAHVCLHTWPGEKAAAIDVYVGNVAADQSARARGLRGRAHARTSATY